jgi:carboxyl-terminal processing protease
MRSLAARIVAAVLLLTCPCAPSLADEDASALYTHVQALRAESSRLRERGGEADLKAALAKLQEAVAILDRPDTRERATGWLPLYFRNHDVRLDMAIVYARLGDIDHAIEALETMQRYSWNPRIDTFFAKIPGLEALRADPRYNVLMERGRVAQRVMRPPSIATPYKERLSVEERIAGLSLYWAEAREHFAWFDNVPDLDWTATYMEFLPRVIAAETTRDYYRVMMELAPRLRDGHTNIYPPAELRDQFYSRPPMRTKLLGDHVVVTEVSSPKLATSVHVGDEVAAIDGVPVREYAASRVRPFASASTPQDLAVRMYEYQLLAGDKATPVVLTLRDADGRQRDERVARAGYDDVKAHENFQFRMLPGDIAYLPLEQFENDAGVKAFVAALPQILKARGLVLDVRRNGGGSTEHGLEILSYLVKDPIPQSTARLRSDLGARRDDSIRWAPDIFPDQPYVQGHDTYFTGPVAVLVGANTFSAAEDFLVSYDVVKRGPIVGEASGGSTGQPMMVPLPGGGMGRICAKRDSYPDGRRFVGVGIRPTIEIHPTIEDIRAGRDPVLERAIRALAS